MIQSGTDRFSNGGGPIQDLANEHIGADDEIAAVPEIAFGNVSLGGRLIRLFDEGGDLRQGWARGGDIAIGRRGLCRNHAQGDDTPVHCRRNSLFHRPAKRFVVRNVVVRRHEQIDGVGRAATGPERGGGHGGGRVTPFRFEQDDGAGPDLLQLLQDRLSVRDAADHDQLAGAVCQVDHASDRLLKQRTISSERNELLGAGRSRRRPQACS